MRSTLTAHGRCWQAGLCTASAIDPESQHGNICRDMGKRDAEWRALIEQARLDERRIVEESFAGTAAKARREGEIAGLVAALECLNSQHREIEALITKTESAPVK